jgi:hypothetical protein
MLADSEGKISVMAANSGPHRMHGLVLNDSKTSSQRFFFDIRVASTDDLSLSAFGRGVQIQRPTSPSLDHWPEDLRNHESTEPSGV